MTAADVQPRVSRARHRMHGQGKGTLA